LSRPSTEAEEGWIRQAVFAGIDPAKLGLCCVEDGSTARAAIEL